MNILELNLGLFLVVAFLLVLIRKTKFSQKLFLFIVTVQMVAINGLRHVSVGNDTLRYERSFFSTQQIDSFTKLKAIDYEFGYQMAQKIVSLFTESFNVWLFIVAFFVYILLGKFIFRYSKSFFFSYLLFIGMGFFDFSLSGIKQTIAIIIILYSYKYILSRNFVKFLTMILFASLFHLSAVVFLPMYFLSKIKWKRYNIASYAGAYIVFFIFRMQIGKVLTLLYYDESARIFDKYSSSGTIGGLAIFLLLILLMGIIVYSPRKYNERENVVLSNIMVVSFFIQSLSSFSYLFTRLNMFYLIFIILYIPNVLNNIDKLPIRINRSEIQVIRGVLKAIIIILVVLYYISNLYSNTAGIIPYYFFWEY